MCVAPLIRLPHNQLLTDFDPPGVVFANPLNISQTNNVCVAPLIRLPHNQLLTDFDPPGVVFANPLNISQTNNVCVAPSAPKKAPPSGGAFSFLFDILKMLVTSNCYCY